MITTLEYNKIILSKVSFHTELFEKELFKALQSMIPQNRFLLLGWCHYKYSFKHYRIIRKFFPKKIRKSILRILPKAMC